MGTTMTRVPTRDAAILQIATDCGTVVEVCRADRARAALAAAADAYTRAAAAYTRAAAADAYTRAADVYSRAAVDDADAARAAARADAVAMLRALAAKLEVVCAD
jgi:hypothetical protein